MSDFPVPFNGDWSREHVGAISVTQDWPLDQQALRLITSLSLESVLGWSLRSGGRAQRCVLLYHSHPLTAIVVVARQPQATTFFFFYQGRRLKV